MARECSAYLWMMMSTWAQRVVAEQGADDVFFISCVIAKAKTGGKKRSGQPSAYNIYMKVQLAKLKEEQEKSGKKADHKENFKKVAADWKTAPENPKNKK
ncbi:hypothetical protein CNBD2550 [Cryptococcus deneoformans B-3501A]|uniref:hypothetical protein n=1 Tax=Cryptococcus deneoformans (strain B-3501A) TaxID=283643 RepID=UPI000042D59D|nr:hypothetical protein CNBD2550 [Cryptococcus neoformans var. neoformans B-3501A]EAL21198.1 hypothetical protein CNBD2550 [Cryptococcus neoformans var. neoformans B-3501A]